MYACMHACMYICMHVFSLYMYTYTCVYICMYLYMYTHMCLCVRVCLPVMCTCRHFSVLDGGVSMGHKCVYSRAGVYAQTCLHTHVRGCQNFGPFVGS